jgi:flavorubredoxin
MINHVAKITDSISWIGVNDRQKHRFENLWPLERGMAYNSYVIVDEKIAVLDTVERSFLEDYLEKLDEVLAGRPVDYLIVNHMEPDHTGVLREMTERYPDMQLVGNKKTFQFLDNFYCVEGNRLEVKEGDELDLGSRKLMFSMMPMVHWPEVMVTYDHKEQVLFSADAFGSFGALDGGLFDSDFDIPREFESEMRRYYSNIVGKYGAQVQRALKKLSALEIQTICPLHGPVWREKIPYLLDLYDRWSRLEGEAGVVIVYGSMYGHTGKMAERLARRLRENGVTEIKLFDASKTHLSYILQEVWKYEGLIIGSCAYNNAVFPPVADLLSKLEHWGVKNRTVGAFGNYTWSGGGLKGILATFEKLKLEPVGPNVEAQSCMHFAEEVLLDELAVNMAKAVIKEEC